MAAPEDLQAMIKVSSEIGESESKIFFTNQCIKAQEDLYNRLKQEIRRREEQLGFMKNDKERLEIEIKFGENEIKCASTANEALRCANVEQRKELLSLVETYLNLVEHVEDGEKKYETMWLEAKQRFEGIPFVQEWMTASQHAEALNTKLDALDHEAQMLEKEKQQKKQQVVAEERRLIINLAEFLNGYNATLKYIKEKQEEVTKLSKELETLKTERSTKYGHVTAISSSITQMDLEPVKEPGSKLVGENWLNLCKNIYEDSLMMPMLHSPTMDKYTLNLKLDLKKVSTEATSARQTISISELDPTKTVKPDDSLNQDYMSCYFSKPTFVPEVNTKHSDTTSGYRDRKLINILDNIQLNDDETYEIISKTNTENLQKVNVISANTLDEKNGKVSPKNDKGPIISEEIEEIDLTAGNSQKILMPPTQFADMIEGDFGTKGLQDTTTRTEMVNMSIQQSGESGQKVGITKQDPSEKRVSFDIPMPSPHDVSSEMETENTSYKANETMESVISQDDDNPNEDNFMIMKEMLMKKHQLDLSPQFYYGKNNAAKKKSDEKVVTSKFFETNENQPDAKQTYKIIEIEEALDNTATNNKQSSGPIQDTNNQNIEKIDEDNTHSSLPRERPVAGMLFSHGPQGIPDGLDILTSTTGDEDGDEDYPQYLDSSLLTSPKADHDLPPTNLSGNGNLPGVTSQEVPNFLAGFKKAGLSFFQPSPETSAENSSQKQDNNFNFNFGGGSDEKKSRGLFSFFH